MYYLVPTRAWVLCTEDDNKGLRIRDYREEISLEELADLVPRY